MACTKTLNMVLRNIITLMKDVTVQFVIRNGAVNSRVFFFFNVICM